MADEDIIINALRLARIKIRTVEAFLGEHDTLECNGLRGVIDDFCEGGEVKALEAALAELGVIV